MSLSGGTKKNMACVTKENAELSVPTPKISKLVNKILKISEEKLLKLQARQLNPSTSKGEKVPKYPKKKDSDSKTTVKPKLRNTSYSHGKPTVSKIHFRRSSSASPLPGSSNSQTEEKEKESGNETIFESIFQQSMFPSPIPGPSNNEMMEKRKKIREGMIVSPKEMEYRLNAHKYSPYYPKFKKLKRFNTRFGLPTLPKYMEFDIFTPEELNSLSMNGLPEIENRMGVTVPGEKYSHIFKDMPIDTYDESFDIKEENKMLKELCKSRKKGRPRLIGYRGVPFSDDALDMHYGISVPSSSSSTGKNKKTKKNNHQRKGKVAILHSPPATSADKKIFNNVCSNIVGSRKGKIAKNKKLSKVPASEIKPVIPNIRKNKKPSKVPASEMKPVIPNVRISRSAGKMKEMFLTSTTKAENKTVIGELSTKIIKFEKGAAIQPIQNTGPEKYISSTLLNNEKPMNNLVLRICIPKLSF